MRSSACPRRSVSKSKTLPVLRIEYDSLADLPVSPAPLADARVPDSKRPMSVISPAQLRLLVRHSTLLLYLCTALIITCAQHTLVDISAGCQTVLRTFGVQHQPTHVHPDPTAMLYFLHIPRTAGRTYGACFLKQAWAPSRRCAKSYDVLRLNTSIPNCGLLSSHDDFSVSQYLPAQAAIATQLRDPVQRVLSTYEFAIEVAARSLAGPPQSDPTKVSTQDVWPWSLLVPLMRQDLERRVSQQSSQNITAVSAFQ